MGELKEITSEIFGLENNKALKTIIDLTLKPGKTIRTYCNEKNKTYLRPFSYLFAVIGLTVLIGQFVPNAYLESINKNRETEYNQKLNKIDKNSKNYQFEVKNHNFQQNFNHFLSTQYGQYAFAVLITIIHLLIFKNLKEGLKNNVWFTVFCFSHTSFFGLIITTPLSFFQNISIDFTAVFFTYIAVFFYRIWACKQFYQISWKRSIIKNMFIYLLIFLFIVIFMFVAIISLAFSIR
ncbi:MAG: DUF3667 domain-containing protein [Crocinitomicaceae bacterium]|nr:DUF3667 domain-containing protein [Crocinitomicaceae bacterium]